MSWSMRFNRDSSGHLATLPVPASGIPRPATGGGSGSAGRSKTLVDGTIAGFVVLSDPCGERKKKRGGLQAVLPLL